MLFSVYIIYLLSQVSGDILLLVDRNVVVDLIRPIYAQVQHKLRNEKSLFFLFFFFLNASFSVLNVQYRSYQKKRLVHHSTCRFELERQKGLFALLYKHSLYLVAQETQQHKCVLKYVQNVHSVYYDTFVISKTPVCFQNSPFYCLSVKCNYLVPFQ